jgi:S1-C subfamily serine protease
MLKKFLAPLMALSITATALASGQVATVIKKAKPGVVAFYRTDRRTGEERDGGTGVLVDKRGYIVTVSHVVNGRTVVPFSFEDGTRGQADVVLDLPECEIAVLKVRGGKKEFPCVALATSAPEVGDAVLAIGHPFGFRYTVSAGLVSSLGGEITLPSGYTLKDVVQTDAAINDGNSGGPLLNRRGEVVGLAVAYHQEANCIGWAVPANQVRQALKRAVTGK